MEAISQIAPKLQAQLQKRAEQSPERPSTTPGNECPACGGTGYVRVERNGTSGVAQCECRKKRVLDSQIRAISERFRHCTFANYVPTDALETKAVERIQATPGGNFYLYGAYRRGKTHLAVAQCRMLAEAGESCMFLSMADLLHELRRKELDAEYFSKVVERVKYAETFHLFIDDIDKFKPTEFKAEGLYGLFNTIYARKLGITVTTNLSLQALTDSEKLDPAIVRRLDDICEAIEL